MDKLPLELFQLIAGHLPLLATPQTLLTLGLTNHAFYHIVHPLLYSCLILKNEHDAIGILQRIILADSKLGKLVRELHMMADLSLATRKGETAFDVVTGLTMAVEAGLLPHMHTLTLDLLRSREAYTQEFALFSNEFWMTLRSNCPRLQRLHLLKLGDKDLDPWLEESAIFDSVGLKGFTSLSLGWTRRFRFNRDIKILFFNIQRVMPFLRTLVLKLPISWSVDNPSTLMILHFPYLRTLVLEHVLIQDTSELMSFWYRHPNLERLELPQLNPDSLWFSNNIKPGLLPNLKHLKAPYKEVQVLAPLLHQLISLSISNSVNCQVPFLLRSVLPSGLPNLMSLEIGQEPSRQQEIVNMEGAMWYENIDGTFCEQKRNLRAASRMFATLYMHSIVRGAPNLEELSLCGNILIPSVITSLRPSLAELTRLQRFYYTGYSGYVTLSRLRVAREDFVATAQALAEMCGRLVMVTDTHPNTSTHLTARISRNMDGSIKTVTAGEGYGKQIGREDDPFP